jgi:hypothetical protein
MPSSLRLMTVPIKVEPIEDAVSQYTPVSYPSTLSQQRLPLV